VLFRSDLPLAAVATAENQYYLPGFSGGDIGQYIFAIYNIAIGLAAILAVIMIMAGGVLWLLAGGSPERVNNAKSYISSALLGLFLALSSFIILQTINPRLIELENPFGKLSTSEKDGISSFIQSTDCTEKTGKVIPEGDLRACEDFCGSPNFKIVPVLDVQGIAAKSCCICTKIPSDCQVGSYDNCYHLGMPEGCWIKSQPPFNLCEQQPSLEDFFPAD